jgi:hypothetical protein
MLENFRARIMRLTYILGLSKLPQSLFPSERCLAFPWVSHSSDGKRVLADIDADHGDCRIELVWHSVLLVFGTPCQLPLLAGREHGRTIPLAVIGRIEFPQCADVCRARAFVRNGRGKPVRAP